MAMNNAAETALANLLFLNTAWANVGNGAGLQPSGVAGNLFIALHTADPGATGDQTTSETAYTNYTRIGVARAAGGWTLTGNPCAVSNTALITFPTCGVTGATLTYASIGTLTSGAGVILAKAVLTSQLIVSNGITPYFAIGALVFTLT